MFSPAFQIVLSTRLVYNILNPKSKDFVLLKKLGSLMNTVSGEEGGSTIDLISVIEELEVVTEEELDFRIEAENTRFFKENCIEDETVVSCPTIIDELSTERILTMTFVDGCSVSKRERLIEEGCDLEKIGKGAVVKNCVLMQDTVIEPNVSAEYIITDKNAVISAGKEVKGSDTYPFYVSKRQTI